MKTVPCKDFLYELHSRHVAIWVTVAWPEHIWENPIHKILHNVVMHGTVQNCTRVTHIYVWITITDN